MVQFSCKCSYTPRLWDSRKNRLSGKSAEAVSVNKELDYPQVNIHKAYESLLDESDAPITAGRVRELVSGLNSEPQGLPHHTGEYIGRSRGRVGIDRSERRLKRLLLLHKHPANFVRYRYRVEDIPMQKADTVLIKGLEDYFTKKKGLKLNTSASYLSMLVPLSRDLHRRYITDTYLFIDHSTRWEVGTPRYIIREEISLITALGEDKLQGHEKALRDMFLFSCPTGLSYTDMYHSTEQHVFHEAGMTWIREPRMKTGNVCHIPLLPEATTIVERYRGIHTRAFRYKPSKGYPLPMPGCDTVSIHLKKIVRLCSIQETLIYYVARHTFASQMTLLGGMPIESTPKMLGYSQIKTTQVYAETSPERVFLGIEKIFPQLVHYQLTN